MPGEGSAAARQLAQKSTEPRETLRAHLQPSRIVNGCDVRRAPAKAELDVGFHTTLRVLFRLKVFDLHFACCLFFNRHLGFLSVDRPITLRPEFARLRFSARRENMAREFGHPGFFIAAGARPPLKHAVPETFL